MQTEEHDKIPEESVKFKGIRQIDIKPTLLDNYYDAQTRVLARFLGTEEQKRRLFLAEKRHKMIKDALRKAEKSHAFFKPVATVNPPGNMGDMDKDIGEPNCSNEGDAMNSQNHRQQSEDPGRVPEPARVTVEGHFAVAGGFIHEDEAVDGHPPIIGQAQLPASIANGAGTVVVAGALTHITPTTAPLAGALEADPALLTAASPPQGNYSITEPIQVLTVAAPGHLNGFMTAKRASMRSSGQAFPPVDYIYTPGTVSMLPDLKQDCSLTDTKSLAPTH